MAGSSLIPISGLERHPTKQTVWFKGVPINLRAIAQGYAPPLNVPYLSRIFAGKRKPSIEMARQVAEALGMELTAFIEGLDACPYTAPEERDNHVR